MSGWLKSWFDFDEFLTTRLLKVIYFGVTGLIVLGVVVGVFGGLAGCATALRFDSFRGAAAALGMMLLYVLGGVMLAVLWRVWCEMTILAFKINENLQAVKDALAGRS